MVSNYESEAHRSLDLRLLHLAERAYPSRSTAWLLGSTPRQSAKAGGRLRLAPDLAVHAGRIPSGGPLTNFEPRPAIPRGAKGSIPQDDGLQPGARPGVWWRYKHRRDNSAPCVKVPSPACQSLPWPKSSLRDQATRARTTGQARAAGRIRGKPERTR